MWWHTVRHGRGSEGGNWRVEWVASTLHTTSEHGVSSITTADAHTLAASSRLNWRQPPIQMDSSFSPKDENWFQCLCHHISIGLHKLQCSPRGCCPLPSVSSLLLGRRPTLYRQVAHRTARTRHAVCYTNTADSTLRPCWRPHVRAPVEQCFVLRTRRQVTHCEATRNPTMWLDSSNQTSITLLIVWWSCKRRCVSFDWTVTICTEQLK